MTPIWKSVILSFLYYSPYIKNKKRYIGHNILLIGCPGGLFWYGGLDLGSNLVQACQSSWFDQVNSNKFELKNHVHQHLHFVKLNWFNQIYDLFLDQVAQIKWI